jgi:hypothetical protein
MSVATQARPKFELGVDRRRQVGQNVSSRWAIFFLVPIIIRPIKRPAIHLYQTAGDALKASQRCVLTRLSFGDFESFQTNMI